MVTTMTPTQTPNITIIKIAFAITFINIVNINYKDKFIVLFL